MILLRPDCLVFRTVEGEDIPCSAHEVTVEVFDNGASQGTHSFGVNPSAFGVHSDWGFDRVQPAFYAQTGSGMKGKQFCLAIEAGLGAYP